MIEDVRNMKSTEGLKSFEVQFAKPHCIVLDSAYCSMGRMIGVKACRAAGYAYYDSVVLLDLLEDSPVTIEEVKKYEEGLRNRKWTKEELLADPEYIRLAEAFDKAADIALKNGPCLIHDRITKEEVLKKGYTCVSAMTYAEDIPAKIERAIFSPLYAHLTDEKEVLEKITEEDMIRINWHAGHSDIPWGEKENYDIMLNTDLLGRDYTAEVLAMVMRDGTGEG